MNNCSLSQDLWFQDRNHEEYLKTLAEKLDINYLMDTAININSENQKYKKIIRIDFAGIAATTLLLKKTQQHL